MGGTKCTDCGTTKLMPNKDSPALCSECISGLHHELNQISRKDDRYTSRGKIKNRLKDIPDEAIPQRMALHIEEVADPSIQNRCFYQGKLKELKRITQTEIRDIDTDHQQHHEGKYVVKKRHR